MADEEKTPIESAKEAVEVIGAVIKMAGDHPVIKTAGGNLAKSAKTLTEFINVGLLPIAAINYGYEKARRYFETKFPSDIEMAAANIPPEALQQPAPSVIGPVLQGLAFTHEEDSLKEMYLRLIATSMDNRRATSAHPAFAEIIRQLNGTEARLLERTLVKFEFPIVEIRLAKYDKEERFTKFSYPSSYWVLRTHVAPISNSDGTPFVSQEFPAMVDNWIRLGLVKVSYNTQYSAENSYKWVKDRPEYLYWVPQDAPPEQKLEVTNGQLKVTAFGRQFAVAIGAGGGAR